MQAIQTFVRIRPDLSQNVAVLDFSQESGEIRVPVTQTSLQFDRVFGPEAKQNSVFASIVPCLEGVLNGYNTTLFAYGQTGSGKTHTMLGPEGRLTLSPAEMGIIPRCARLIFSNITEAFKEGKGDVQFQVRASFLEIYNGRVFDLLSDQGSRRPLKIRADGACGGAIDIAGATQEVVKTTESVMKVLATGSKQRATACTDMNMHSSRSHAIFILYVEKRVRQAGDDKNDRNKYKCYISRVNLVDLAGSEDVTRSNVAGTQFKEAVNINTGLLQLHRVLDALSKGEQFVPYRDSALTRVLQDSLGGTSRTIFLAHVSPLAPNSQETASTLKYAAVARTIKNSAKANIEQREDEEASCTNDYDDPRGWKRRTMWINTPAYGKVFARCAGAIANPLILMVHGSGPENSSIWWNELVLQLLDTTGGNKYFFVQIDCPGYGRSPGDKQTIRSYPAEFLIQIIQSIGHTHAYCLVGSSQGTASIFNATFDHSNIAKFLVGMDPVTHNPQRFEALKQPCMLVYDVDDPGHPVSVGRVVRRIIPTNYYFEFARSKDPFWHARNLANEMLSMFEKHKNVPASRSAYACRKDGCDGECKTTSLYTNTSGGKTAVPQNIEGDDLGGENDDDDGGRKRTSLYTNTSGGKATVAQNNKGGENDDDDDDDCDYKNALGGKATVAQNNKGDDRDYHVDDDDGCTMTTPHGRVLAWLTPFAREWSNNELWPKQKVSAIAHDEACSVNRNVDIGSDTTADTNRSIITSTNTDINGNNGSDSSIVCADDSSIVCADDSTGRSLNAFNNNNDDNTNLNNSNSNNLDNNFSRQETASIANNVHNTNTTNNNINNNNTNNQHKVSSTTDELAAMHALYEVQIASQSQGGDMFEREGVRRDNDTGGDAEECTEVRAQRERDEDMQTSCHMCACVIRERIVTDSAVSERLVSERARSHVSEHVMNERIVTDSAASERLMSESGRCVVPDTHVVAVGGGSTCVCVRLDPCRHLLCIKCAMWTVGINRNDCPIAHCPRGRITAVYDESRVSNLTTIREQSCATNSPTTQKEPHVSNFSTIRKNELCNGKLTIADDQSNSHITKDSTKQRFSIPRPLPEYYPGEAHVMLEFGNTANLVKTDAQGRCEITASISVLSSQSRNVPSGHLIQCVGFDINPAYANSAVKVSNPGPYVLSRTMACAFPCNFEVTWRRDLKWKKLTIMFKVQREAADFRRRVLVRIVRNSQGGVGVWGSNPSVLDANAGAKMSANASSSAKTDANANGSANLNAGAKTNSNANAYSGANASGNLDANSGANSAGSRGLRRANSNNSANAMQNFANANGGRGEKEAVYWWWNKDIDKHTLSHVDMYV